MSNAGADGSGRGGCFFSRASCKLWKMSLRVAGPVQEVGADKTRIRKGRRQLRDKYPRRYFSQVLPETCELRLSENNLLSQELLTPYLSWRAPTSQGAFFSMSRVPAYCWHKELHKQLSLSPRRQTIVTPLWFLARVSRGRIVSGPEGSCSDFGQCEAGEDNQCPNQPGSLQDRLQRF